MLHTIKNYVFDIDSTISTLGKKVDDLLCQKLLALTKENRLIFASARPVRDMLPMLNNELHSQAIFIGCNGTMAYQNGEFLFSHLLPKTQAEYLISFLTQHHIPYVLDGKWGFSLSQTPHEFHNYICNLSQAEQNEASLVQEGIAKILILDNNKKAELINYANLHQLSVHTHKSEDIFDITLSGNNKYYTLKEIIGNESYIAFGNDQNDFLMLDNADISVFIGNKNDYPNANYYLSTNEILNFLNKEDMK